MNTRSSLLASLAAVVAVAACTGGAVRDAMASPTSARGSALPTSSNTPPSEIPVASGTLTGRIAFDNWDDVYTIDADGSNLTRLTNAPIHEFDPSWSPDGTRIAYRTDAGDVTEIWLMNADGSDKHRLTDGLSPAWSPDGSIIAFAGPKGSTGVITLIRPDGTGLRQLADTEGGEYPSWSPDGTRIAFNENLSGNHRMHIAQVDGSGVTGPIGGGEGWQVAWSPDGATILFTSHRDHPDNYTDVYAMDPDGSNVRRLTENSAYTPAWSPDGRHIVFSAPGLFVMNADGTGLVSLRTDVGETSLPDWTD
jgi:TolB protein